MSNKYAENVIKMKSSSCQKHKHQQLHLICCNFSCTKYLQLLCQDCLKDHPAHEISSIKGLKQLFTDTANEFQLQKEKKSSNNQFSHFIQIMQGREKALKSAQEYYQISQQCLKIHEQLVNSIEQTYHYSHEFGKQLEEFLQQASNFKNGEQIQTKLNSIKSCIDNDAKQTVLLTKKSDIEKKLLQFSQNSDKLNANFLGLLNTANEQKNNLVIQLKAYNEKNSEFIQQQQLEQKKNQQKKDLEQQQKPADSKKQSNQKPEDNKSHQSEKQQQQQYTKQKQEVSITNNKSVQDEDKKFKDLKIKSQKKSEEDDDDDEDDSSEEDDDEEEHGTPVQKSKDISRVSKSNASIDNRSKPSSTYQKDIKDLSQNTKQLIQNKKQSIDKEDEEEEKNDKVKTLQKIQLQNKPSEKNKSYVSQQVKPGSLNTPSFTKNEEENEEDDEDEEDDEEDDDEEEEEDEDVSQLQTSQKPDTSNLASDAKTSSIEQFKGLSTNTKQNQKSNQQTPSQNQDEEDEEDSDEDDEEDEDEEDDEEEEEEDDYTDQTQTQGPSTQKKADITESSNFNSDVNQNTFQTPVQKKSKPFKKSAEKINQKQQIQQIPVKLQNNISESTVAQQSTIQKTDLRYFEKIKDEKQKHHNIDQNFSHLTQQEEAKLNQHFRKKSDHSNKSQDKKKQKSNNNFHIDNNQELNNTLENNTLIISPIKPETIKENLFNNSERQNKNWEFVKDHDQIEHQQIPKTIGNNQNLNIFGQLNTFKDQNLILTEQKLFKQTQDFQKPQFKEDFSKQNQSEQKENSSLYNSFQKGASQKSQQNGPIEQKIMFRIKDIDEWSEANACKKILFKFIGEGEGHQALDDFGFWLTGKKNQYFLKKKQGEHFYFEFNKRIQNDIFCGESQVHCSVCRNKLPEQFKEMIQ